MSIWWHLVLWGVISAAPLVHGWIRRTPMALSLGASLVLAHLAQAIAEWRWGFDLFLVLGAVNPVLLDQPHRLVTSAWLHADFIHLLGNLVVIQLVGVPLEQRLGRGRFVLVYLIGALGGNLGWIATHWGQNGWALGASGAAFGLLGCYLACWPRDEIEFPIILIRRWPVAWIALFKFGMEVFQYGFLSGQTNVAHLAHITGFLACYVLAKPIARGGLVPIGTADGGPSATGGVEAVRAATKARMGSTGEDPWGEDLSDAAARVMRRLREEGDEIETRQAWLEELAEVVRCPTCDGDVEAFDKQGATVLRCMAARGHLEWP